eukprot:scaffold3739_cov207-Isochrysis_galbana.AAC.1
MSALPWPFSSGAEFGDLEAPNALAQAAAGVARTVVSTETGVLQRELVMLATAPDQTSIQMTLNAIASLAMVGLDKHVLLLADSATTCASFSQPCYWSSRVLTNAPGPKAIVQVKFWDWRFRYYYVKKAYLSRLVRLGFSVIQADTDTIWEHDPFPMLRSMSSSLVVMVDSELANAGLIYTRPGSREAVDILDEVAWRIQLLQNYPEMAGTIVPYAKPPYYVRGAQPPRAGLGFPKHVQRPSLRVWRPSRNRPPPDRRATRRQTPTTRRSCATSCGRPYEARSRYKATGPDFQKLPEFKDYQSTRATFTSRGKRVSVVVPWASGERTDYSHWLLPPSNDSFAIAPRRLFALIPYSPKNAVTHLTATRGFNAKVDYLKSVGKWLIGEQAEQAALAGRSAARKTARNARLIPGRQPPTGRDRRSGLTDQTAGHKHHLRGRKLRPTPTPAGRSWLWASWAAARNSSFR